MQPIDYQFVQIVDFIVQPWLIVYKEKNPVSLVSFSCLPFTTISRYVRRRNFIYFSFAKNPLDLFAINKTVLNVNSKVPNMLQMLEVKWRQQNHIIVPVLLIYFFLMYV